MICYSDTINNIFNKAALSWANRFRWFFFVKFQLNEYFLNKAG